MDLNELQNEVVAWADINFPKRDLEGKLIGMTEELGELISKKLEEIVPVLHIVRCLGKASHHHEKQRWGKGTHEFHEAKIKDAIGDIFIFMIDYCHLKGWKISDVITDTWNEVKQRNWKEDPLTGMIKHEGQDC